MVRHPVQIRLQSVRVSVLALSSRFDGPVDAGRVPGQGIVSVLALSSRFDGPVSATVNISMPWRFSTRSVESF